jgi:hypothetical protein
VDLDQIVLMGVDKSDVSKHFNTCLSGSHRPGQKMRRCLAIVCNNGEIIVNLRDRPRSRREGNSGPCPGTIQKLHGPRIVKYLSKELGKHTESSSIP